MLLKILKILSIMLLTLVAVLYAVDRLLLAPVCPPCHSDKTRALPIFAQGRGAANDGLIKIATGYHFRARTAGFGNSGGEGVVLLHGYPETSIMWKPLLEPLAKAGYRVVAFDQRGYSPGARPGGLSNYNIAELTADVTAVADAVGFGRFHLIGHDWGGLVSWMTAERFPDRISSLSILSMPHPNAYGEALFSSDDQLRRSSYVLLNWMPWVAEFVLRFNKAAYLQRHSWASKSPEQLAEYLNVFTEPGALEAVLKWYRAFSILDEGQIGKTRQPTLYLWGHQDRSLGRVGADKTADYVTGPFQFFKLDAGHALLAEATDEVTGAILQHLKQWPASRQPRAQATEKLPLPWHLRRAQCPASKPHCLQIIVNPKDNSIHVVNNCEKRFAGTVRLECSNWPKGAAQDYFFDLNPQGSFQAMARGLDSGSCYYDQRVCEPQ